MALDDDVYGQSFAVVVEAGRNSIATTVEDVVHSLAFRAVEGRIKAIADVTGGQRLESGEHVEDEITSLVLEVARVAFDIGRRFDVALCQVEAASDSLLRDYAAVMEDNGEG